MTRPFFSIGVTTYDRVELLRETLDSIRNQSFRDFEVIVSNDNPKREIAADSLLCNDARFRFVNQEANLGEFGNMNYLLNAARGEYFSWIADDDLYAPNFLEEAYRNIRRHPGVRCVFTSFGVTRKPGDMASVAAQEGELFTGREFLGRFLSGRARAIGVMGVFQTEYLKQLGGLEDVSRDNRGLLSEYLLVIRAAALDRMCYIDSPLAYYRAHDEAWGIRNTDIGIYQIAGRNLVRMCVDIFRAAELRVDYGSLLYGVMRLCLSYVYGTATKNPRRFSSRGLLVYYLSLGRELRPLRGTGLFTRAGIAWLRAGVWILWAISKFAFRSLMPDPLVRIARKVRSLLLCARGA